MFRISLLIILLHYTICSIGQHKTENSLFKVYTIKGIPENRFGEILISKGGQKYISASEFSFAKLIFGSYGTHTYNLTREYGIKNFNEVFTGDPIKAFAESIDRNIFFATNKNQIVYLKNSNLGMILDIPPFYFPIKGDSSREIKKLWFDNEDNLYIGAAEGSFYIAPKAGSKTSLDTGKYKIGKSNDDNMFIQKGELPVKKIIVGKGIGVYVFAESLADKNIIWLGTSNGLYEYNKITGKVNKCLPIDEKITITHIEIPGNGDIWFSTLEKGMGVYHQFTKSVEFFSYPQKTVGAGTLYPIQNFCIKSTDDFFVAIKDSLPAIFNIRNKSYHFIDDSSFILSKNSTTDIKLDKTGNFYLIKGGLLYSAHISDNPEWLGPLKMNMTYTPSIISVKDFNNNTLAGYFFWDDEITGKVELKNNQNSIIINFTSNYYSDDTKTQFAWTLVGDLKNWVELPALDPAEGNISKAKLVNLKPGKYIFRVRVKIGDNDWSTNEAYLEIIIIPAYWQTWWFWTAVICGLGLIIGLIFWWQIRAVKKREKEKFAHEKQVLELEAKALRAQMNPHFIFNCLNSIKSLIQQNENKKSVIYLTTFSKLIRTLLNNADKKEISLFDEIETCKLYLQLEAMRFDTKFSFTVNVAENIDLKSVQVPALIIQPFIENAIWHGIIPHNSGGHVSLNVLYKDEVISVVIDDDGIGREASQQNKSASGLTHQSKGVNLTQSRLELNNLLQQRKAEMEIIDKKDENGVATGTTVILSFKESE